MAGALDRDAEAALVAGAGAGLAAWLDLAALGQVAAQARHVLVVDLYYTVNAEGAHLAAGYVAVATSAGPATRATRAAGTRAAAKAASASTTAGTRAATIAASSTTGAAWACRAVLSAAGATWATAGAAGSSRLGGLLPAVSVRVRVVCLVCHIPW